MVWRFMANPFWWEGLGLRTLSVMSLIVNRFDKPLYNPVLLVMTPAIREVMPAT